MNGIVKTIRLYVIGSINEESYEKFSRELFELEQNRIKDIEVEVFSEGGDASAGLAFYGRIISSRLNIIAIAHGECSSAAMMILAAADKRKCTKECTFYIHNSEEKLTGDYHAMTKKRNELERMEILWSELLADNSSVSAETWMYLSESNRILSAKEALDFGLIDEVIK